MHQWKSLNTIYIYDGSFDGLLTIVFDSYLAKSIPNTIVNQEYEINFFCQYITIQTDEEKANRIRNGILDNVSYHTLSYAYHVFLSNSPNKEMDILNYLLLGFTIGNKIDHLLSNPLVLKIQKTSKRVFGEAHRLKGLTRFIQIKPHLFYAKVHPDNNVLELLGHHFMARLSCESFIIHDQNRNLAFLYNTKTYIILEANGLKLDKISDEEKFYQDLWKTFYHTIGIKERKNSRLRMQYMPKKYWQDLIEDIENV